jgi:putative PIG3 family NAD(P)H quinone oxidoreductase
VLEVRESPEPTLGEGELLIRVEASALNRADLLQRRGLYAPPPGATEILGLECAGTVIDTGPGADATWLGRRVMALLPGGGYAERVAIPERMAVEVPQQMDFTHAAAIPEAFMTANEALFERARLEPGESVLVHAAAGGVGSAVVQLALVEGAHVVGTAGGSDKQRFVEALGAECLDYRKQDFSLQLQSAAPSRRFDVIVDFIGSRYWNAHAELLAPGGRLVVLGLLGGTEPARIDFAQLLRRQQSVLGMVMRSRSPAEKIALTRRFVRRVLPLLEAGTVKPLVHAVFELERVQAAHTMMEANENLGKIVLRIC